MWICKHYNRRRGNDIATYKLFFFDHQKDGSEEKYGRTGTGVPWIILDDCLCAA